MTQDVLNVALAEYRKWHEKLKDSAAYQNLKEWEMIILSQGGVIPSEEKIVKKRPIEPLKIVAPQPKKTGTGKIAQAKALAADFISKSGGHAHRTPIHEYLSSKGIHITPRSLSVILSESPEFESNRKLGWSVKNSAAA